MLFIYKLHISQSQHLQKQCQEWGDVLQSPAVTASLLEAQPFLQKK